MATPSSSTTSFSNTDSSGVGSGGSSICSREISSLFMDTQSVRARWAASGDHHRYEVMPDLAGSGSSVMGGLLQVDGKFEAYRASYGAAATTESLDEVGAAFTAVLANIIALARKETAIRKVRFAMRRPRKF